MRACVLLPALLSASLLLEPGLARPLQEFALYDVEEEYGCNMPLAKLCSYPELEVDCNRKKQCNYIKQALAAMEPLPDLDEASIAIETYERPKKKKQHFRQS